MERLSERCGDYIRIKGCSALYANEERKGAYLNNAVVRFADYEDTGMEPEQITAAQKAMRAGLALACALQAYRAIGTVEELSALVKARDEGRLVELPCKRGDKVWRICGPKGRKFVAERTVLSVTIYEPGQFEIFTNCSDWLGRTVFLTRQEAEAALGGSGDV
jgi:hypothetical protein